MAGGSDRRFAWLVRLFPAATREDHGVEMEQVLRAQYHERPRGVFGPVRFWASATVDALKVAPRQHLEALVQDLRYAVRGLRRAPSFAIAALAIIALGTGATSAVFAVVNAVLFRPLPYVDPARVALVWAVTPGGSTTWLSAPEIDDIARSARAIDGIAGLTDLRFGLTGSGTPEELQIVAASSQLFPLLGVRPQIGRLVEPADDLENAARVVVLSDGLWRRRFGASPGVVGSPVTLDGRSYTVVGVLPPSFTVLPPSSVFPAKTDAWVALQPHLVSRARDIRYLHAIARIAPAASIAGARGELRALGDVLTREHANAYRDGTWSFTVVRMQDDVLKGVRPALLVLFATVGLVLLGACANVAALLLARGEGRRREMAVRAALGASRARIVRQLVTEGLALALIGGLAGLAIAATLPGVASLPPLSSLPRFDEIAIDWRVVGFAVAVSLVTALIFAVAPALELSSLKGVRATETLRASGRSRRTLRAGRILAALEIALAALVLAVALLMARGFSRLLHVEAGFDTSGLVTMRVALPPKYNAAGAVTRFFDGALERIRALPGVTNAAAVSQLPLSGALLASTFVTESATAAGGKLAVDADLRGVSADYFETMGIELTAGRLLTAADLASSPAVAVIDETLQRRLWPNGDAIGRRIQWIRQPDRAIEIVGVVRAVRHRGSDQPARETVYRPHAQYPRFTMYLVARTAADPSGMAGAVAAAVHAIDPNQPVSDVMTMEARARVALAPSAFGAGLGSLLALLAVALAIAGVYGLFAFTVAQRRKEISVRLALGATSARLTRTVLGEAVGIAACGLGAGLPLALAAARWVRAHVIGMPEFDAALVGSVAVVMVGAAMAACWFPARRAARVDPAGALRAE
jgi:putative ABC transport system permease protein